MIKKKMQTFKFKNQKSFGNNSTVSQCRCGLFAPVQKVSNKSNLAAGKITIGELEISFDKVLTQIHQDIILSLLSFFEKRGKKHEKNIIIAFSPTRILREMGVDEKNTAWLFDKIKEISDTNINLKIETPERRLKISEKIIIQIGTSEFKNIASPFRNCFAYVLFGEIYSKYFDFDVKMKISDDTLKSLFKIKNGVVKALAKYVLTQSNSKNFSFNAPLEKILFEIKAINEKTPGRTKRQLIKFIHDQKSFLKEKFGITVSEKNKNIVFYEPLTNVYFKNIEPASKNAGLDNLKLLEK